MISDHDWAAVIGAELETGDPPLAYVCQHCGRKLPGLIVLVDASGRHDAWLRPSPPAGDVFRKINIA